jgi:uncharacterized protein YlaI
MRPIHPEGEELHTDPIGTLICPHCRERISFPELANVEVFVCPECGERIQLPQRLEQRP